MLARYLAFSWWHPWQLVSLILMLLVLNSCTLPPQKKVLFTPSPSSTFIETYAITSHTVERGDTLSKIAQQYDKSWRRLAKINKLRPPYVIHPGQVIYLGKTYKESPVVQPTPRPVVRKPILPPAPTYQPPVYQPPVYQPPIYEPPPAEPVYTPPPKPVVEQPTVNTPIFEEPPKWTPPTYNPPNPAKPTRQLDLGGIYGNAVTPPPSHAQMTCSPAVNWKWPVYGKTEETIAPTGNQGINIYGAVGDTIKSAAAGSVIYSGYGVNGYYNLIILRHNDAFISIYANNQTRLVNEGQYVRSGQTIAKMGFASNQKPLLYFEIRCQGKAVDPLRYLPG